MHLIPVSSSWVDSYAYDSGDMYIQYKDKRGKPTALCHYANVPLSVWTGLLSAASKGSYIHSSGIISMPYTII